MQVDELKAALHNSIRNECLTYFGDVGQKWINYAADYFWDESAQDFRLHDLTNNGAVPGKSRILDIAAGCGQFVFRANDIGFECYGLEPEQWKMEFIRNKITVLNKQEAVFCKFVSGIGENIPFPDEYFDAVTSYQTLEHVQDPFQVVSEMVRVTKEGGVILIRCPDYRSTYEAHYHLPWMPLMPKSFAEAYLRLLGRPSKGLETIQYITQRSIYRWLSKIEGMSDIKLHVTDANYVAFSNRVRKLGWSFPTLLYPFYLCSMYFFNIFRREMAVNITVRVASKGSNVNPK
jgi:ubiquinone/menaquinone biosynthesis C-methylase UbiE